MAALSLLPKNGPSHIVASPIFWLNPPKLRQGEKLLFEVLEKDAASLEGLLNKLEQFSIGSHEYSFTGKLTCLVPCESSHEGLALLRDKATLRGELTIVSVGVPTVQN